MHLQIIYYVVVWKKNKQIVANYDSFKMFSFKTTRMAVIQLSSIYDVDNQLQLKQIKEMYYFQETHLLF